MSKYRFVLMFRDVLFWAGSHINTLPTPPPPHQNCLARQRAEQFRQTVQRIETACMAVGIDLPDCLKWSLLKSSKHFHDSGFQFSSCKEILSCVNVLQSPMIYFSWVIRSNFLKTALPTVKIHLKLHQGYQQCMNVHFLVSIIRIKK